MPTKKTPRISVEALAETKAILFDKSRFSGSELARALGVEQNALWMDFTKRGLLLSDAREIAAICDDWAKEMKKVANTLRARVHQITLLGDTAPDIQPT